MNGFRRLAALWVLAAFVMSGCAHHQASVGCGEQCGPSDGLDFAVLQESCDSCDDTRVVNGADAVRQNAADMDSDFVGTLLPGIPDTADSAGP